MGSIQQFLISLHQEISEEFPEIVRIAAVTYDAETDEVKTFVQSNRGNSPLQHYSEKLENVPSLQNLAKSRDRRILENLSHAHDVSNFHSRAIVHSGYQSSYTIPFFDDHLLAGFLFFNSTSSQFFTSMVEQKLKIYRELIISNILNSLTHIRFLRSHIKMLCNISNCRDIETGTHLKRMAHYTRLIAKNIANKYAFDDEFIEYLYMFAPLHDIGKISIPDSILLKKGKLTDEEYTVMKRHIISGEHIIQNMIESLNLNKIRHIPMLLNIVRYHHECFNGSGYCEGLQGDEIPIEARIITVADVFDALTSERPYKKAWSNEEAYQYLLQAAGEQLDPDCVHAFLQAKNEIESIQDLFTSEYVAEGSAYFPQLEIEFPLKD